ncbi:MAG: four helix bundle protein [Syntrophaceae bacterium]|jgi:four helix bundle protein|nr:four helix bundle protein [Syntrophaceae bacterium]
MAFRSFEDLEVWKKACALAVKTCRTVDGCRNFGFKDQMTRSSLSIASNIAEGAERDSKAEFVRFLNIAKGSAAELRTQLYIAEASKIISSAEAQELIAEVKELSRMMQGLVRSIRRPSI